MQPSADLRFLDERPGGDRRAPVDLDPRWFAMGERRRDTARHVARLCHRHQRRHRTRLLRLFGLVPRLYRVLSLYIAALYAMPSTMTTTAQARFLRYCVECCDVRRQHAVQARHQAEQQAECDADAGASPVPRAVALHRSTLRGDAEDRACAVVCHCTRHRHRIKGALVAITVFFLVLNSTLDGVRNVDREAASLPSRRQHGPACCSAPGRTR